MELWQKQFNRVRRFYRRFEDLTQGCLAKSTEDEYTDDTLAFFQNCYHLKDHLKNDPSFKRYTGDQIESFVTETKSLAICADICNGTKHLTMSRTPRSGNDSHLVLLTTHIHRTYEGNVDEQTIPNHSKTVIRIEFVIFHGSSVLDAFEIVTDAMKAWEKFLS